MVSRRPSVIRLVGRPSSPLDPALTPLFYNFRHVSRPGSQSVVYHLRHIQYSDLSSTDIAGHFEEVQTERSYVTYPDVLLYSVPIPTPEEDLFLGGKEALGGQDVVPPTPPPSPTRLPKAARQLVLQVPHGLDNEKNGDDPAVRQRTTALQKQRVVAPSYTTSSHDAHGREATLSFQTEPLKLKNASSDTIHGVNITTIKTPPVEPQCQLRMSTIDSTQEAQVTGQPPLSPRQRQECDMVKDYMRRRLRGATWESTSNQGLKPLEECDVSLRTDFTSFLCERAINKVCAQLELDAPFREIQTTLNVDKPTRSGYVTIAEEGQLTLVSRNPGSSARERLRRLREELNKSREGSVRVLTVSELNTPQTPSDAAIVSV